jgi:cytochrome c biogenesis protein CcdA/thiol-disulfide isomerase/thioredoxin
MLTLLLVGFIGGLITGLSPCILPVLPVIVAGGATSTDRRRPYFIIAGLVATFSVVTLVSGSILSFLHLPQDLLRNVGIAMLLILALGLLVPAVGEWLEKPFARLGGSRQATSGSGFVLGASLGLLFVPCAGPVLAAISVVAATHRVGLTSIFLTLAYAIGTAIPLLIFAIVAQRTATGWKTLRSHTPMVRRVAGVILALTALAIAFNVTRPLQTAVPGYASAIENHIEGSPGAKKQLQQLSGEHTNKFAGGQSTTAGTLKELGDAPDFTGITAWLNTPGDKPLTLKQLKGKVVLVDFWTYSCINCQRSLPHVEAWYKDYAKDGLVVVGVHTPEFPFEHVVSNVKAASQQLGVDYPVAVDDNYGTWDAYNNEYWPAEYLIDQEGHVRYTAFGEGDYSTTESNIRALLTAGGAKDLPRGTDVANLTPTEESTPETYVGYDRQANFVGTATVNDKATNYALSNDIQEDESSLGGTWDVHKEEATAGANAKLAIYYMASDVYLVLGGQGTVTVSVGGKVTKTVTVSGIPNLYTLLSGPQSTSGLMTLSFSPGVQAFDFTFG